MKGTLDPATAAWLGLQADVGIDEVVFDEVLPVIHPPVALPRPAAPPLPDLSELRKEDPLLSRPVPPPSTRKPVAKRSQPSAPVAAQDDWEAVTSLEQFHDKVRQADGYRRNSGEVVFGIGPSRPPFFFVSFLPSPEEVKLRKFLFGDPGELFRRLLAALSIEDNLCYHTWFCKQARSKPPMPREAAMLRHMLEAEVRLVQPASVVFLGEACMQAAFTTGEDIATGAGLLRSFAGVPATALEDPQRMLQDPGLKALTWNEHIPRSGLFPTRLRRST